MPTSPFPHRELGVLLHPSSLAGPEPIGTLGAEAHAFVDWLATTGSSLWQILPLTLNGQYDSPYFSFSAFAGNPWLVDLRHLQAHGLLPGLALPTEPTDAAVPFAELPQRKRPHLLAAAEAFLADTEHPWREAFDTFAGTHPWLEDTCHFFALKEEHADAPWWRWPDGLRHRDPSTVAASKEALHDRMQVWAALFFFVDLQWAEVREHARSLGLRILGDLPIYVNHDSADVWLDQDEFQLDADGGLLVQSGVPPDYFSETGQLWGNPLYRWDVMRDTSYRWWVARLTRCLELTDLVRIDHFRALAAYWEVPGDAADARAGRWVPGPGQHFLDVLRTEFPTMPFVAEDLGTLDDAVYALRDDNGLFGMRILQFGFDGTPDNDHRPDRFPTACIAYTGTHDNDTVAAWWACLDDDTRHAVAAYYQFEPSADAGRVAWSLIEAAIGSRADVAVVPIQDLLVLDGRARMNDPSVFVGNWSWRMPPDGLSAELAASLRALAERYGRARPA
jgi:4-alpha-glucanotransferase